MLDLIIESTLFGFGIFSILLFLIIIITKRSNLLWVQNIDYAAVILVRIAGILYLIVLLGNTINTYVSTNSGYGKFGIINIMFGPFWFISWLYPFVYFGLTQLLWIDKLKKSSTFRILLALAIILTYFIESLIIVITSFNSDYIPSRWTYINYGFSDNLIINCLIEVGIFGLMVGLTYLITKKKIVA